VNQLSGGEQQRVALARSLAPRPRLLMLDEPLSSLDRTLRERLMDELREILTRVGQTAIYVTHDQQEAFALADRLVILNAGRVAQAGTPQDVYARPADAFVARFLGMNNLLPGQASSDQPLRVTTALGTLSLAERVCQDGDVTVLIRPEAAELGGDMNMIEATLVERSFRGRNTRVVVCANDITLEFELPSSANLPVIGNTLRLSLRPDGIACLPASQS
jgi:thiamine transport system ATP-binding protein